MKKFKIKDKVLIGSVPASLTSFRKSLSKLKGKQGEVVDSEYRNHSALKGFYYLVSVDGKVVWLHELNLEVV